MKLNPDCLRDVMLYLEKNIVYTGEHGLYEHSEIPQHKIVNELTSYNPDDVTYSIEKLLEAKYIEVNTIIRGTRNRIINFHISSITYEGHQFLDDVRPETFWKVAKNKFKTIGRPSVGVLAKIAAFAANLYATNPDKFNEMFGNMIQMIEK